MDKIWACAHIKHSCSFCNKNTSYNCYGFNEYYQI